MTLFDGLVLDGFLAAWLAAPCCSLAARPAASLLLPDGSRVILKH
jgi:hypothetical protein